VRRLLCFGGALALIGLLSAAFMYSVAVRDPVVRRATVHMPDWPASSQPMRVVLLSDIHVAGPDMPPTRLRRIVEQVNALRPDAVLMAGDFVSDKRVATRFYSGAEGLAPLARLRARHGVWAVLGNHDHWRDAAEISKALGRANVRVLSNAAASVGPMRLGGVDDDFTDQADVPATHSAMRQRPGSRVLLTHSPDVAPSVPTDITLILAGHTHCGQIRLPIIGAVSYESRFGDRYSCGLKQEGRRRVVTTAGLGTSVLPLRLGAPPELWLLTLTAPPRTR
jgi:predicted MPP superfamily phosphohydrolase